MLKIITTLFAVALMAAFVATTADARGRGGGGGFRGGGFHGGAFHGGFRGGGFHGGYRGGFRGGYRGGFRGPVLGWPGAYYGWAYDPYDYWGQSSCARVPVRVWRNNHWVVRRVWRC